MRGCGRICAVDDELCVVAEGYARGTTCYARLWKDMRGSRHVMRGYGRICLFRNMQCAEMVQYQKTGFGI